MYIESTQLLEQHWERVRNMPGTQKLNRQGLAYVHSALFQGRSREVGKGSLFSNTGGIATKSGLLVDFESEGGEGTFIYLCELDDTELLLEQPPQITVYAHDSRGRRQNRRQRPDFVKVTKQAISLVEVKMLSAIYEKQKRYPKDWLSDGQGGWTYRPGIEAAKAMGMEYHVFYPEQFTSQYRANITYLAAMRRNQNDSGPRPRLVRSIKRSLSEQPRTIGQLLSKFTDVSGDDLIVLMQKGEIHGLLAHQTLSVDFVLYGDTEQRDRAKGDIESHRVKTIEPGSFNDRLIRASPSAVAKARACAERYKERRRSGINLNSTDYRHRIGMLAAIAEGAPAIAGLIPRYSDRGGPGTPLSEEDASMLKAFLREYLADLKRIPSPSEAHAELVLRHEGSGKVLPSVETVRRHLAKEFTPERAAALYGGPRAIQKARRKTEGTRCIERIGEAMNSHCDAVYNDIVPKDIEDWKFTRPIAFPLVMSPSLYIASTGIMFGSPSSLGFLMALRCCIQDHGWLPMSICHDRGPELNNFVFRELAGSLGLDHLRRATAYSEAGGPVEAVNGELNAFLQTLPGGTYHDQAGRDADAFRKGRNTAKYDFRGVVQAILKWVDCWNTNKHGGNLYSPKELFEQHLTAFGSSVKKVPMTDYTRYLTSYPLDVKKFTYQRGAAFSGKKYSCDAATKLIHAGETPQGMRLDCLDPSIIWGSSSQGLVCLTSNAHHRVAGMGRVDRILAMAETMRYSRQAKRNNAEYRQAQAYLRRELREAADHALDVAVQTNICTAEQVPDQARGKHDDAAPKISFAELFNAPRGSLETIRAEPSDES